MKHFAVEITDRALVDMDALYTYIAETLLSPETAMQQYNRIAEAVEFLTTLPERCRRFESQPERDMGLRLMPVDNYSVIYSIDENRVVVLRVLYSASDIIARLRDE